MKVAAFVLLLAVAGLLVVGAVDAKKVPCQKPKLACASAEANACATGMNYAAASTCTDTYTNTAGHCATAGASSGSDSISS